MPQIYAKPLIRQGPKGSFALNELPIFMLFQQCSENHLNTYAKTVGFSIALSDNLST